MRNRKPVMLYMNQAMSLTFLAMHTTPLLTALLHIDAGSALEEDAIAMLQQHPKSGRHADVHLS